MSGTYERPPAVTGGLRLHLNENTSGCSPRVLEAIGALEGDDIAFYPEYDEVVGETAAALGVDRDWLLLVNGLDEGLLAATIAAVRPSVQVRGGVRPEVIVPLPAFDMYGIFARATGAALVEVQPRAGFRFQADEVIAAMTSGTRLVFITSPNNPTGVRVDLADIARVAEAVPEGALVFVDEAYHDFCGDSALPLAAMRTNVVVGRTFAKAHGLAALRAGCVMGPPATLDLMRPIVPPYSLNVCAAAGLRAALTDTVRHAWYVEQVQQSRGLVYDLCERLHLQCWESGANFVLVRIGAGSARVAAELGARGIFVRDRSKDAGCEGCLRITAGVVEHTRRCLAALEEILCGEG
jgi:histidinol-phosphate aminotransferase